MIDEAFWLIFLYIHFSKNLYSGWRLLKDIYGSLGKIKIHWYLEKNNNNDPLDHLEIG